MTTALMVIDQPRVNTAEVEAWRLHVLLQAGYPLKVAERISRSNADLHTAVDLLERGCAAHVAARILN